jgi:hypothetical protein
LPYYYHFYVESRSTGGWGVPAGFQPEWNVFENRRLFGEFVWAHPRCGWLSLFFSIDPLFTMRPGQPDDRGGSALLKYLDSYYDYERNEDSLCWLPYEELFVDCWDTDTVLVTRETLVRYANLFGDGQQPFPCAELLAAGMDEAALDRLRNGWRVSEPVDVTFGPHRYWLSELPPEFPFAVTWRETISEFIRFHADAFKHLQRYGRDCDLRILALRG